MSMRLDKLFIALLIFSVILISGVSMIADINSNYEINMSTSEFKDTYNNITKVYGLSTDMNEKIEGSQIETDTAFDSTVKGAISTVKLMPQITSLFKAIVNDIADAIKVPPIFIQAAIIALTIFIIFALVYLFMRFKP